MMMIVADSFLVARDKRGEFKELADAGKELNDSDLTELVRQEHIRVIGRYPVQEEQESARPTANRISKPAVTWMASRRRSAMFLSPESIYRMEFEFGRWTRMGADILPSNWRMRWPTH